MKRIVTLLLSIVCLYSFGQTTTKNYIKTYTAREAISTTLIGNNNPAQTSQSVQYFDGLGRPEQTIVRWGSSTTEALIVPIEYDAFGRQVKQHLPVPYGSTSTNFVSTSTVLSTGQTYYTGRFGASDANAAYSNTVFEASPLNRAFSTAAPGADWHANPVEYNYETNLAGKVKKWVWDDLQVSAEDYYAANQLYKNTTTDEDDNETIEYTDKQGRTIMKKSQIGADWAETYYIYDDFNRLRVVIPPQAHQEVATYYSNSGPIDGYDRKTSHQTISSSTTNFNWAYTFETSVTIVPDISGPTVISSTGGASAHIKPIEVLTPDFLADWAFQYEYDGRGRMISKQVPGAGKVLMVYDSWDRLVLTQDAVQRLSSEWLFTKYDDLNRPVMTGIMTGGSESAVRAAAANPANDRGENFSSGGTNQYTNDTYPSTNLTYLTVTFYDNYGWDNTGLTFSDPLTQQTHNTSVKGQVTGSLTKAGNGTWIKSASYYDNKYRPIQTQSTNHLHANGKDVVTNYYNFANEVTKTISSHYDGTTTTEITREFDYDHNGRLLTVHHQLGSNPADKQLIVSNTYSEIGELIEKDLHDGEQSVDYDYNIRGWLRSINDSGLTSVGDTETDLFGMELFYNGSAGLTGQTTRLNGNISAVKWSDLDPTASGVTNRAYTYSYDNLNRLTNADHFENGNNSFNRYDMSIPTNGYDLNGNIKALTRRAENGGAYMDNLTYTYKGNQLLSVTDAGDDNEGFKDGNTSGNDYTYDANGNMTSDKNKGITSIEYNHLNLPISVSLNDSEGSHTIEYLYDAAGIKLQQKVFDGATLAKTTDYVGEFIYETIGTGTRKLQLIQHEEGRLIYDDYGHAWDYQYHLKDHLGNTRLTFSTLSMDPLVCVETFETGEDNGFQDLHRHENSNANTTAGGNEVERLQSGQTGAMVLLAVNKNDTVSMEVQANYEQAPTGNSFLGTAFMTLFNSFDNIYGSGVEGGGLAANSQEFDYAISGTAMDGKGDASTAPRAFLNFILFDKDMNYVHAGFEQISTAALGTGVHETLAINNYVPTQDGYILVYLSNENTEAVNIHFDDFTVTQMKTHIVQSDDYYPFGLTFNGYSRTASTPQNFLYNGKELQEETGWYDYGARMYMADIGRWGVVDPEAEIYLEWSPYNYVKNNPLIYIDPDGRKLKFVGSRKFRREMRSNYRKLSRMSSTFASQRKQLRRSKNTHTVQEVTEGGRKELGKRFVNGEIGQTELLVGGEFGKNPAVLDDSEKFYGVNGELDDRQSSNGIGTGSTMYIARDAFDEDPAANPNNNPGGSGNTSLYGVIAHETSHQVDADDGVRTPVGEDKTGAGENRAISRENTVITEVNKFLKDNGINFQFELRKTDDEK
ncbi:MAG: DUF6443 domain-containing protein [Cyclobacteriaceae bacterium]